MKLIFIFIFTVYVLYNAVYNSNNRNNFGGVLIKGLNKSVTYKQYYDKVRRTRKRTTSQRVNTTKTYLVWLILLSGDVELNPGPATVVTCTTCQQTFARTSRLRNHQLSAAPTSCEICNAVFCHESRKQQHMLREHVGSGTGGGGTPLQNDLDLPILSSTGYHETDEYKAAIDEHHSTIRSQTNTGSEWRNVNVEIPPTFSYRDLKVLLDEVRNEEHGAFKIIIGFGSMLYDTVNQVYRYFYVSNNHYLFDRAFTISTNRDMTTFFNKILSLQLTDKYYLQRPSSGWTLAGLPNLKIRVMRLRGVPIGAGVQLPAHIKNSKSIIGLTR